MGRRLKTKSRVEKNIDWIQKYCRIPEGPDVGRKVELRPWQKAEIEKIYGNPHGTRRAIISLGRKNAKSTFAAFLLLLHLCGPEYRPNGQLYSSAKSREQAGLIFALAAKIVRLSRVLRRVIIVREFAKQLLCPDLGTSYRALSAEAKTAFGLSPVFIIHDELGQVEGPTSPLYEALETAVGAQANPLSIIISTQAPMDGDLLSVLIDDALAAHDPRVVISLHTAPVDADPFDEATIKVANPAYGDFLNATEVMAMAEDARRMPSREAEFRNLILNQRVESSSPFINKSDWMACGDPVIADWGNAPVYAGLDLSAVADLTALVLMAWIDGKWQVRSHFWLPEEGIRERARLEHVPYDIWAREGHLDLTPGKSVEYEYVAERIRAICGGMNVKKIAYDRWSFVHLKPWLIKAGFTERDIEEKFFEFGQGYKSMSPALRAAESLILNRKIAHGNHPVLSMCAARAVVTMDPAGNRKLDKKKSRARIDGMVCLAMAAGVAEAVPEEKPKQYQMMIV